MPIVSGAGILCSMGTAPGNLNATAQTSVFLGGAPAATIFDVQPISNISPCGLCTSMANPTVSSATAAALGVLTPMPCVPSPLGTWSGSPCPMYAGKPGLASDGTLMCAYGGSIQLLAPGQTTVQY